MVLVFSLLNLNVHWDSLVQLIYKQDFPETDILIQEYIKTDGDVRVVIVGDKIIGTMKRKVVEGDFRSNYTQGGGVEKYELSDEEIRDCMIVSQRSLTVTLLQLTLSHTKANLIS